MGKNNRHFIRQVVLFELYFFPKVSASNGSPSHPPPPLIVRVPLSVSPGTLPRSVRAATRRRTALRDRPPPLDVLRRKGFLRPRYDVENYVEIYHSEALLAHKQYDQKARS